MTTIKANPTLLVTAVSFVVACSSSAPTTRTSNARLPEGPIACTFESYAPAGSTVTWTTGPSGNTAGAHIVEAPYTSAGFDCFFSQDKKTFNLSSYDTLEFDGTIPAGTLFTVGVGHNVNNVWHGCSWNLMGQDTATYSIDLNNPNWCGPTQCGYDLQSTNVTFQAIYANQTAVTADIAVTRVEFLTKNAGAGTIALPQSGKGPGGACWFLTTWGTGATAQWFAPLTSSSAKAHLTGPNDNGVSGAGMQREFGQADVSRAQGVSFQGTVASGQAFAATLTDNSTQPGPNGCWWNLTGSGTGTYSINPAMPDGCYGPTSLDLTHIHDIQFQACCGQAFDVEVTSVAVNAQ
jgi:hypothetical protein